MMTHSKPKKRKAPFPLAIPEALRSYLESKAKEADRTLTREILRRLEGSRLQDMGAQQ